MSKVTYEEVLEKGVYIEPTAFRILVLPDPLDDGIREEDEFLQVGELFIPKNTEYADDHKREVAAQVYGTVVKIGAIAFRDFDKFATAESWHKWAKEGDKVAYARYSNQQVEDPVTKIKYALINDRDLTLVISK